MKMEKITSVKSFMKNVKEKIVGYNHYKAIIYAIVICGLLSHGTFLLKKIAVHDEIYAMFGTGMSLSGGRWMNFLLGKFFSDFFRDGLYSLTIINSCIAFVCVGICVVIISMLYQIESDTYIFILTSLMISTPAMTSMLGYTFVAANLMIGMLCSVMGAFLICFSLSLGSKMKKTIIASIGSLLIACSVGEYQIWIGMATAIVLGNWLLVLVGKDEAYKWKSFFTDGCYYLFFLILSLVEYLIINKIFLVVMNCELSDYQGIASYGAGSFAEYMKRLVDIYREFLFPSQSQSSLYTGILLYVYWIILLIFIMYILWVIKELCLKNRKIAGMSLLVVSLFPIGQDLISLIIDTKQTHLVALSYYSKICFFMLIGGLIYVKLDNCKKTRIILSNAMIVVLFFLLICNIRYDNICYMYANMMQEQTISYMQTLATRIQSLDGYDSNFPIIYVNEHEKKVEENRFVEQFDDEYIVSPYGIEWINDYAWKQFMSFWCGFDPKVISQKEANISPEEIQAMTTYPKDGSIKIIDKYIVVKFN